jgi:hypothetical protein
MTEQDKEQLNIEISHIFESGANHLRIFEMVENFIDNRYKAINYTHCCTELRDKEAPNIEDWLKDNFKRLGRHSFTNTHEDTIWLRSELVEVYNQLHP